MRHQEKNLDPAWDLKYAGKPPSFHTEETQNTIICNFHFLSIDRSRVMV